ncbi:S8 family serine peptidase [Arvimicrobium flavum]|uniref:S8 family serine peptidase n=1 Tax=Arvimicrobium flavum TaxID=3393320 RepID=UPI00237BCA90|nr:S8 family serine peptidase [Mesorhizobium shangrilense]
MRAMSAFSALPIIATLFAGTVFSGPAAAQTAVDPAPMTLDFLRGAVEDSMRRMAARDKKVEPKVEETGGPKEAAQPPEPKAPKGASAHEASPDAELVESKAEPMSRTKPKAGAGLSRSPGFDPGDWMQLSFVGASFTPEPGIGDTLLKALESGRGDDTFAFLVMETDPDEAMQQDLQKLGVELLGRHDDAQKVRLPLNRGVLDAILRLPGVHSIGYARPEQKIEPALARTLSAYGSDADRFPVIVNLFAADRDNVFARRMEELGVEIVSYDAGLQAYEALASLGEVRQLAEQDFVLFIEVEKPSQGGHDESMPTTSVDYIRAAGFTGVSTVFGILDTGFMVGGAAATMHQDLNKNGCGANFTTDAAGVWNDQNGHGTHVLATATGTGTAQARFRGVATGVGDRHRIRAGKIWNSMNSGQNAWLRNAMDFLDDETACDAPRPEVINLSGGARGTSMNGTDAESRKLDDKVWQFRQAYIVCGGNTGQGAGTIWSPGVAKNALTVGNVEDNTANQVGELAFNSSFGPTGDGRMKPNVVATGRTVTSADAGTTNQYANDAGCSMATPHVSGIAATLLEHYPDFRGRPHLLRAHLMASTVLHHDEVLPANNSSGGRNDFGLGRLSDYQSHWAHNNPNGWTGHWAWWNGITNNRWGSWDLDVPRGTDRLVVVMAWDEPQSSSGATAAVTYDLDLWADFNADCTPDGHGQCGEWASQSYDDNTEYLIIDFPPAGVYRLKVINWDAPSFGLPTAIAAKIVRGDPTPATSLSAFANPTNPAVGSTVTITARVDNPAFEAYGVHAAVAAVPAGVTLLETRTVREDGVAMTFPNATGLTLGSIVQGDSREATWRFRIDTGGPKTFGVRSWSDNGGTNTRNVVVTP